MSVVQQVAVTGMSCGHCVAAVEQELLAVPGVAAVAVDLATGQVEISSDAHLSTDVVRAAVQQAGYELAE